MELLNSVVPALAAEHRRGAFLIVVLLLVVIGLLVWLVVRSKRAASGTASARAVLAERFAKGEIDNDEYQQRREQLK